MAVNEPAAPNWNASQDVQYFFSRPEISAPKFDFMYSDPPHVSDGYYFAGTWKNSKTPDGPYIFDADGQLIWAGSAVFASAMTLGLSVCEYQGSPHLCTWEGSLIQTTGRGRGAILDSSYQVVHTVAGEQGKALDFHEFHTIAEGTRAIASYYQSVPYDLSPFNVNFSRQTGFIGLAGFQEIDLNSGKLLFEWNSLAHVDPTTSMVQLGSSGQGQIQNDPWDYFHINSVQKLDDGNYIVSGRHTSTIYKISGVDGSIIWRLGGNQSDFTADFEFGYQHDVRVRKSGRIETVISLFNNGWDGRHDLVSNASSGLLVTLNHVQHTAKVMAEFYPQHNISTRSQGNMATIPGSDNFYVSWGNIGTMTEHLRDGTLVLNISLGNAKAHTYRGFKAPWQGHPTERPTAWGYARSETSQTVCYASWNGATQVARWRFYGGPGGQHADAMAKIGETKRTGFETRFIDPAFHEVVRAEAIAADGTVLGASSTVTTWVPGEELAANCNDIQCPISLRRENWLRPPNAGPRIAPTTLEVVPVWQQWQPWAMEVTERVFATIGLGYVCVRMIRMTRLHQYGQGWLRGRRQRVDSMYVD